MSQLSSFQYDIFQRYSVLAAALQAAFPARKTVKVLDVGSGPALLTKSFLPARFQVTAADVDTGGSAEIVQLQPGEPLPFEDSAFDAVVCMDVLEHIPPPQRDGYIDEIARVGSGLALIAFPHDSDAVREGERLLDQGYLKLFGQRCDFLVEHEQHGLPPVTGVAARLGERGLESVVAGVSPLPEWLLYSYLDLLSLKIFQLGPEKDEVNRRFNEALDVGRAPDHFYRAMLIASRNRRMLGQAERAVFQGAVSRDDHGDFGLPLAAFDATTLLAERLRKKAFEEAHAAIAKELAATSVSRAAIDAIHGQVETAAHMIAEVRQTVLAQDQVAAALAKLEAASAEIRGYREELEVERSAHRQTQLELQRHRDVQQRIVMENTAVLDQVKSLSESLARQAQIHELKLNEVHGRLDERGAALELAQQALAQARESLAESQQALAEARRERDSHANSIASLSAAIARETQLHTDRVEEMSRRLQERVQLLQQLTETAANLRRERDAAHQMIARECARLEALEAELGKMRGEVAEAHGLVAAERERFAAAQAAFARELEGERRRYGELESAMERARFLIDSQQVEIGRVSTRLRCERRARLMDAKQLEPQRRRA